MTDQYTLERLSEVLEEIDTTDSDVQDAVRVIANWISNGGDAIDTTANLCGLVMMVPWSRADTSVDGTIVIELPDDSPTVTFRDSYEDAPEDAHQCQYWRSFIDELTGETVTTNNGYTITFA